MWLLIIEHKWFYNIGYFRDRDVRKSSTSEDKEGKEKLSLCFENAEEDWNSTIELSGAYKEWETNFNGNSASFHCGNGDLLLR